MGRSYAHVLLPVPHLDAEHRTRFDATLAEVGWQPVPDDVVRAEHGSPVLTHRWRHPNAGTLMLVVVGWYPLVCTIGPDGRPTPRSRRGVRRVTEAAVAAGGRELPDRDLDRVVQAGRERWSKALEARQVIEEQRAFLECRHCQACGAWSAYGVLHCRGCARRFAPADDAERDERGRQASDATAAAEQTLRVLGRGEGLFADWPEEGAQ